MVWPGLFGPAQGTKKNPGPKHGKSGGNWAGPGTRPVAGQTFFRRQPHGLDRPWHEKTRAARARFRPLIVFIYELQYDLSYSSDFFSPSKTSPYAIYCSPSNSCHLVLVLFSD